MKEGVKKVCLEEEVIPTCEVKRNLNSVTTVQMFCPIENTIHGNELQSTPIHEPNKFSSRYCIGQTHFDLEESAFKPFFQIKPPQITIEVAEGVYKVI
jgi:hypothetical protein